MKGSGRFDFDVSLEKLIRKHPNVCSYDVKRVSDIPRDHKMRDFRNIADHVDTSWKDTYVYTSGQAKGRFVYTAGYFNWLFGDSEKNKELITLVLDKAEVAGLAVVVPRRVRFDSGILDSGTLTAISINPNYKRQGLMQLINLHIKQQMFDQTDGQPYLLWWDSINSDKGHSLTIFKEKDSTIDFIGAFPIVYRMYDYKRAVQTLHLASYEKPIVKFTSDIKKGSGVDAKVMDANNADEFYSRFLNRRNPNKRIQRLWNKDEFIYQSTFSNPFSDDAFTPLYIAYAKSGKIIGASLAYRIPITQIGTDNFMFTDHFVVEEGTSISDMRKMLREGERLASEEFDIMGGCYLQGFDNSNAFTLGFGNLKYAYMSEFPIPRSLVLGLSSSIELNRMPKKSEIFYDHK